MIQLELLEVEGFQPAIHGMRNPHNSHNWSDSNKEEIGEKDLDLMRRLAKAGPDHGKYLRMINVYVDITAPLYWWKEADTYKIGTVSNSTSTMHSIEEKEFTPEMFSIEHVDNTMVHRALETTINALNYARELYLESKDKVHWWYMIQILPSSYNQKRTLMINYATLRNMYNQRKNHKLDEWKEMCEWMKTLPYSELITD